MVCEGATLITKPVLSGVQKGSILGPLLFVIYIDDITQICKTPVYLYADDAKVMETITGMVDNTRLQESLKSTVQLSKIWGLTFNSTKCKFISFFSEDPFQTLDLSWTRNLAGMNA